MTTAPAPPRFDVSTFRRLDVSTFRRLDVSRAAADWQTHKHAIFDSVREVWSIPEFRPLQREALEAVLLGRDLLAVMPTAGGKSLCYQAPAAFDAGVTIVVSPLISLMKDQVDSLEGLGIEAAFLNSSQHAHDQARVTQLATTGKLRLLYVAPERVMNAEFVPILMYLHKRRFLDRFVIDEAHCISQWGHDFRPAYAQLGSLRKIFPDVPIHAFTATAAAPVRDEICQQLRLRSELKLIGDFDRPNLILSVVPRGNRDSQVLDFVRQRCDQAGIVYCITRAETDRTANMLRGRHINALSYHAGMDDADRARTQDAYMRGHVDVVCATIAFGMGIDRPDLRWILHASMPPSIEQYHQEIGRAGRDGDPAECVILYDPSDADCWTQIKTSSDEFRGNSLALGHAVSGFVTCLAAMEDFCVKGRVCRHEQLVDYFRSETRPQGGGQPCRTACDVCSEPRPSGSGHTEATS